MSDTVNMSLDEIIKQNRVSRSRGRGGGTVRGGGGRGRGGRGRGGGRGGGGGAARGRSNSRGPQTRGRSQSRAQSQSRGRSRSRSRARSQSRARSLSRQPFRANSQGRSRSRSRSQLRRGVTPRGRAGLEQFQSNAPPLKRKFNRGGQQNGLRGSIQSRLGVTTRRGAGGRPLAISKRGISKRGRGLTTKQYSTVGLRSDQILQEQRRNSMIRSQTFTRSRNNSFSSASQLTVRVANDFARRRRNSVGSGAGAGYLSQQSLAQLNNQFGGYNTRSGPGSVKSMGSNRSNRSNRSSRSNRSTRSRGRGRGRGRGAGRGVGRKFLNKQVLNPRLQKEIAAIQGKLGGAAAATADAPGGVNFAPTPSATRTTLHERFAL